MAVTPVENVSALTQGAATAFGNIAIAGIVGLAVYLTILIYAKSRKLSKSSFKIVDIIAKLAGFGIALAMMSPTTATFWPVILIAIAVGTLAAILLPKRKPEIPIPPAPQTRTTPATPHTSINADIHYTSKQDAPDQPTNINIADSYVKKEKLLTAPEKLMYFILKTGMPNHEIFANVRLADIIKVSDKYDGFDKTVRFRKISQYHLDFVICKTDMTIIAAIEVDDKSHERPDRQKADELKNDCLQHVGIKLIRFKVGKFPRHHEIKHFVYGNIQA